MTAPDLEVRRELLYAALGFSRLPKYQRSSRTARIALLDGAVDMDALPFHDRTAPRPAATEAPGTPSDHATAMASLLVAPGTDETVRLQCWPTLSDTVAPDGMARCAEHLLQACAARPDFILLGFEFTGTAPDFLRRTGTALDAALGAGIPVLAPAGNHGGAVTHPLYAHPALLPVTAAGYAWGPLAARGLAAPGQGLPVVLAGGRRTWAAGTSFATAIAGAALAALAARSNLPATHLCAALCRSGTPASRTLPPEFDVARAFQQLSLS